MPDQPLSLLICNATTSPLAIILQWQKKKGEDMAIILEWVFLPMQSRHCILSHSEALAALVRKGRDRIIELEGAESADISILVCGDQFGWFLQHSIGVQEALIGYTGTVHNNRPKGPLWKMLEQYEWVKRPL